MATYSTGISASYGARVFKEITNVEVTVQSGPDRARAAAVHYTDNNGGATFTTLDVGDVGGGVWGAVDDLIINGGAMAINTQAMYDGFTSVSELNGVTKYTISFKFLE